MNPRIPTEGLPTCFLMDLLGNGPPPNGQPTLRETDMMDWDRSKEELIEELIELRCKVSELQAKQESSRKPPRPSDALVSFGTIIRYLGKKESIAFYARSTHTASKLPQGLESDPVSGRLSWFDVWKRFIHPDDLPGFKDAFDGLIEGRTNAFHKRIRLQHGENEYLNDLFFVAAERDENGKAIAVIESSTRRMKGSREEVEAKYRAEYLTRVKMVLSEDRVLSNLLGTIRNRMSNLLDSIGKQDWKSIVDRDEDLFLLAYHIAIIKKSQEWVPMFIKDRSMKYVWVSKTFSDLLGRSPRDICGRTDREMYGILTKKEEIKTGEAVMTGAIARFSVTRIVDGKPLPFRDLLSALHWGHGQVAWILGLAQLSDMETNPEEGIDGYRSSATTSCHPLRQPGGVPVRTARHLPLWMSHRAAPSLIFCGSSRSRPSPC